MDTLSSEDASLSESATAAVPSHSSSSSHLIRLYIGGLPPSTDDSTVAELLGAFGTVESVTLSRDVGTMKCVGYGFAKMMDIDAAEKAVSALHNKIKLEPELFPQHGPIQVRIVKDSAVAVGQLARPGPAGTVSTDFGIEDGSVTNRPGSNPVKLFIGGVPGTATGKMIRLLFQPFGEILDLFIAPEKGFAFVKYGTSKEALAAMAGVNGVKLQNGIRPLEVRIAQSTKGLETQMTSSSMPSSMTSSSTTNINSSSDTEYADPSLNKNPRIIGKWREYFSQDGTPYYFNQETEVTTWDVPEEFSTLSAVQIPPPPAMDKGPAGSNIFVYGIPVKWTEIDLRNEFSKFGSILSTKVVYDPATGLSKGFGFVSFATVKAARDAVDQMNGAAMPNGKKLKVQIKRGEDSGGYSTGHPY